MNTATALDNLTDNSTPSRAIVAPLTAPPTSLSIHAIKRIRERCQVRLASITGRLEREEYVNVGISPGKTIEHLLFYCDKLDTCFVALRDYLNHTVVTVLPLEYHTQSCWPVSDEQCAEAVRLAKRLNLPKVFKIKLKYFHRGGDIEDTHSLKSVFAGPYGEDPQRFLDEYIRPNLDALLATCKLEPARIYAIVVKFGLSRATLAFDKVAAKRAAEALSVSEPIPSAA